MRYWLPFTLSAAAAIFLCPRWSLKLFDWSQTRNLESLASGFLPHYAVRWSALCQLSAAHSPFLPSRLVLRSHCLKLGQFVGDRCYTCNLLAVDDLLVPGLILLGIIGIPDLPQLWQLLLGFSEVSFFAAILPIDHQHCHPQDRIV